MRVAHTGFLVSLLIFLKVVMYLGKIEHMTKNTQTIRFADLEPSIYPGERLGLPQTGSLSVARIGRRVAAICVDWLLALLLTRLVPVESQYIALVNLGIFAIMQVLFIATLGGSIGHRLLGLRVITLTGSWPGFLKPLVRTLLLCIVVPVLVWDSDQRAFHDKIAGTVLVRV